MSRALSGILLTTILALAACGESVKESEPEPELEFPELTDSLNLDAGSGHAGSELLFGMDQLNAQSPRMMEIPDSPLSGAATRDLLGAIDRLVAAAGGPRRAPLASLHFVDCNPVITGYNGDILIDSDADGIPNDYKVDYGTACVSEPDEGAILRVTLSGYRRLQDIGNGFRSFRVTVKDLVLLVEYLDTGVIHRTVLNGVEEGRFAAGGAHYSTEVTISEFLSAPGEADQEWYRHVDLGLIFVPTAGQTIAFATPLPAGSITLQGLLQFIEPEVADRLYFSFLLDTPTPLQWSPACNGGDFTAGSYRGRYDGRDNVGFQFTWNECSKLGRKLFGYGAP